MKKGILIFLIGIAAVGGAIDTGSDVILPATLLFIGLLMIWLFREEPDEEEDSDSNDRTNDHDDSRPKVLRM